MTLLCLAIKLLGEVFSEITVGMWLFGNVKMLGSISKGQRKDMQRHLVVFVSWLQFFKIGCG